MSANDDGPEKPTERSIEALDDRDVRALTERMTVMPDVGDARGADDLYTVVSHSGSQYLVDARHGRCSCPDAEYNLPTDDGRERCKHVARAEYVTGERPVPSWVDASAIDECIGVGVDTPAVAADGGECDDCAALDGDWPCANCYVRGEKEIPDDE
jgi:predicted nucleic acid-binding Zn finger protein